MNVRSQNRSLIMAGAFLVCFVVFSMGIGCQTAGGGELHDAVDSGDKEHVRKLLDSGVDIELRDALGGTALHRAALRGHVEIVEILLDNGAKIDATDKTGKTPLFLAVVYRKNDIVRLLLNKKASVNATDKHGNTPLHMAAGLGNHRAVELLLSAGADINAKDDPGDGNTPLHLAAGMGKKSVAELLLDKGAVLDARNKSGLTPMHLAAGNGQRNTIELLLQRGANLSAKADDGKTPQQVAVMRGYQSLADLIQRYVPSQSAPAKPAVCDGNEPLTQHIDVLNGFRILYPKQWHDLRKLPPDVTKNIREHYTSPSQTMIFGAIAVDEPASLIVLAQQLLKPTTVDQYFESVWADAKKSAVKPLSLSKEETSVDGSKGIKHVTAGTMPDGRPMHTVMVYTVLGQTAWIIGINASPDWLKGNGDLVDKVMDSVLIFTTMRGENDRLTQYIDAVSGFRILYPKQWQDVRKLPLEITKKFREQFAAPSQTLIFGAISQGEPASIIVVTSELSKPATVDQFFESAWAEVKDSTAKPRSLSKEEVSVAGSKGIKHITAGTMPDGRPMHTVMVYAVLGQTAWTVGVNASPDWLKVNADLVDEVLGSMLIFTPQRGSDN